MNVNGRKSFSNKCDLILLAIKLLFTKGVSINLSGVFSFIRNSFVRTALVRKLINK
jgi:hypothetical protein